MSVKSYDIYTIPGWGFLSSSLDRLACDYINPIGLDYIDMDNRSLDSLAKQLSQNLPNKAILLGWSLGGLIALKLTLLYPDKVDKLILLSNSPRFLSDHNWEGIDQTQANTFIKQFSDDFKKQLFFFLKIVIFPNKVKNNFKKHMIYEDKRLFSLLKILFSSDLRKVYESITTKTLHIISKTDAIVNQKNDQLIKLNPYVQVVELDRMGHAGFLHDPSMYQLIIQDFLND